MVWIPLGLGAYWAPTWRHRGGSGVGADNLMVPEARILGLPTPGTTDGWKEMKRQQKGLRSH